MTVTQLISILEKMPKKAVVVISKGGEGNDFSPLDAAESARYGAENTCRGDLVEEGGVPAVVLWPVN